MGIQTAGEGMMRLLITGVCGFVGSTLANCLLERLEGVRIIGIDNLMRPGSESNVGQLRRLGIDVIHGDLRVDCDIAELPRCDWVVDAAANPSVLAGVSGTSSSRRLFQNNVSAIGNILEYCKQHGAALSLLSSSRVYSISALGSLPLVTREGGYYLDTRNKLPQGVTELGIGETFSTEAPVSLYGASKLASEILALEYGAAFDFPVWITRCGVLAGAGQFGTPDQGIISYWINAHRRRRPMRYTGFGGTGYQTRDVFHPRDLATLLVAQLKTTRHRGSRIYTAGGGIANTISLAQLTRWCDDRFGHHQPGTDSSPRIYDIPWIAMDSSSSMNDFGWHVETPLSKILDEVGEHAERHPEWLQVSGA